MTGNPSKSVEQIQEALQKPFDHKKIKFRPGASSGNKKMALAYIDARDVMDRLDEVVGADNWQTEFYESANRGNAVYCKLSLRLDNEWLVKEDVGTDSKTEAEKGAVSDALKRAAVSWGIGRYLYGFPTQFIEYEGYDFIGEIKIPGFATLDGKPTTRKLGKNARKVSRPSTSVKKKSTATQKKAPTAKAKDNLAKARAYVVPSGLPEHGKSFGELEKTSGGRLVLRYLAGDAPNGKEKMFEPISDEEKKMVGASKFIVKQLKE